MGKTGRCIPAGICIRNRNGRNDRFISDDVNEEYKAWFDANIISSYFDGKYPWTRLGYTYDWADNGQEYGLSEFINQKDSDVTVAI